MKSIETVSKGTRASASKICSGLFQRSAQSMQACFLKRLDPDADSRDTGAFEQPQRLFVYVLRMEFNTDLF